jgi:hypothetical protein
MHHLPMRISALCAGTVAAGLAVGAVAFAQQPRAAKSARAPAVASATPAGSAAAAASSDPSPPPPPPPSDLNDAGLRMSPLNPAPNEFSDAGPAPATLDYDRLLADVASLRARAAAVSDMMFHSRVAISIETSGDHGRIAALTVGLDDGTVWTAPSPFRAEDATQVYDHAVAPGHHAVTIDVERRDDREDAFRTSQRSRFIVDVPADMRVALDVKLWDDSSMGADFPSDKKGTYDLRVRATAKAQPLGGK